MRFRGFLGVLICLSVTAIPAVAQAPAPATTAFDGTYIGTATATGGRYPLTCVTINSMYMTITGGQVAIHEIRPDGTMPTERG
jgi:hypothetical protein